MEVVIKRGMKRKEIDKKLKELENSSEKKKFDAYRYLGKIDWKDEPLNIQTQMRNEWK